MNKLLTILLTISISVFIILTAGRAFSLDTDYYRDHFEDNKIYDLFEEDIDSKAEDLISYFKGKDANFDNFFTERELIHLKDVRDLFVTSSYIHHVNIILLVILIAYIIFTARYKILKKALLYSGISILTLTAMLASSALINFDLAFNLFHKILFEEGTWIFDMEDNLIKLFPSSFFYKTVMNIFITIIVSALALILISNLNKYKLLSKSTR